MTGEWPKEIDHINRIKDDNRFCNLRITTRSLNNVNMIRSRLSKTGVKNVYKRNSKYLVMFSIKNKQTYITACDNLELAELIADEYRSLHYGEFVPS